MRNVPSHSSSFGGSDNHVHWPNNEGPARPPENRSNTCAPSIGLHLRRYAEAFRMATNEKGEKAPLAELSQGHGQANSPLTSFHAGNRATSTETLTEPSHSELSVKARDLTSQVLQFLSTASNETLGACVVGLGATTYFVLGRWDSY